MTSVPFIKPASVIVSKQSVLLSATGTIAMGSTIGAYADLTDGTTTMSITFTPTNAANKIKIFGYMTLGNVNGDGPWFYKLTQDGNDMLVGDDAGSRTRAMGLAFLNQNSDINCIPFCLMTTAGTASSTTIKMRLAPTQASKTLYVNRSFTNTDNSTFLVGTSHMIIIEYSN